MGITNLWEGLRPAFQPRISFESFVVDFIEKRGRPPRLSIDAYMFIFSSGNRMISDELSISTQIRNFMAKMLYLSSLNVTYVVVFDGNFKPAKIKNGKAEMQNYYDQLEAYKESHTRRYGEDNDIVKALLRIVKEHKIDYIQAPGEGEAECASLQRYGVVDYVVSNDSDAFVFGARNVLRNFNRHIQDVSHSPTKSQASSRYFVTPVHMDDVEQLIGLDTSSLILIATLRGGDYSSGADRIGIKNATKLARCGNPIKAKSDEGDDFKKLAQFPNFSKMLINCFIRNDIQEVFGYKTIEKKAETKRKLEKFTFLLNTAIKSKSKVIFGRNLTFEEDIFIDENFTLFYLFPFVSQRLYMFIPGSLSNGMNIFIDRDLKMESILVIRDQKNVQPQSIHRYNNTTESISGIMGYSKIWFLETTGSSSNMEQRFFGNQFTERRLEKNSLVINYRYSTSSLIPKAIALIESFEELSQYLSISKSKIENDIHYLMIRYNEVQVRDLMTIEQEASESSEPYIDSPRVGPNTIRRSEYVWLPQKVLEYINRDFVARCLSELARNKEKQISPKKRKFQKTTLDDLGKFPQSPKKKRREKQDNAIQETKHEQTAIDFHYRKSENPFVDRNAQTEGKYNQIKSSFLKIPPLDVSLPSTVDVHGSPQRGQRKYLSPHSGKAVLSNNFHEEKDTSTNEEGVQSHESSLMEVDPESVKHLFF